MSQNVHLIYFQKQFHLKPFDRYFHQVSADENQRLFSVVQNVAKAAVTGLKAQGINIYLASGPGAGQTAPHLLVNVIPRFENDGIRFGWQPKKQTDEEMLKTAKLISSNIGEERKAIVEEIIADDDEDFVIA